MKGLFCILPRNGVQAFISYGLHCQPVPVKGSTYPQSASQNISSSSSSCGTDGVPCKTGLPTLFEVNWLWASHEDNDDMTENTASERDDSSALKYTHKKESKKHAESTAMESVKALDDMRLPKKRYHFTSTSSEYATTTNDTATGSATVSSTANIAGPTSILPPHCSYLRFSRCSTPSGLDLLDASSLEEGCFIALCRVLISKMHTTKEPLSDELVAEAFTMGFDTVYSKSTDEYVLLRPQYVLPEFVMQVQMCNTPTGSASSGTSNSPNPGQQSQSTTIIPSDIETKVAAAGPGMCKYQHPLDTSLHHIPKAWLPDGLTYNEHNDMMNGGTDGRGDSRSSSSRQAGSVRPNRRASGEVTLRGTGIGSDGSLFAMSVADVLASNEVHAMKHNHKTHHSDKSGKEMSLTQGSSASPSALDMTTGTNGTSDDTTTHIQQQQQQQHDTRVLLLEKQALLLSIQGSVDEFVRHMRDITLDTLHERASGSLEQRGTR